MPATVWSGVIGFGMVSIPVKLFSATSSKRIAFHQLHNKCLSRIKEVRWCPSCDKEVPFDDIVKGYELAKDEYVPITQEDFDQLPMPSKEIIDISSFTEAVAVDPLYLEKNYYLLPDKKGEKAFNLFLKALERKSLLAIGKIAIRSRERLCAIRAVEGTMVLCTLLYEDEIRVDLEEKATAAKIAKPELDMALSLIDVMTQRFDPAAYKDDYREAMKELIDEKTQGLPHKKAKNEQPRAVGDLMEALKASLAGQKRGTSGGSTGAATRRKDNAQPGQKSRAKTNTNAIRSKVKPSSKKGRAA
ncbi:MAG: Ku protein [Cyanobacteria bacterium REEB67]|nr:Ku protein [Cyanobacteria bacterium REEB67]